MFYTLHFAPGSWLLPIIEEFEPLSLLEMLQLINRCDATLTMISTSPGAERYLEAPRYQY